MSAHRPTRFVDFDGQKHVINNLKIAVISAKRQRQPLAHLLLTGPAGLGKTTLGLSVLPSEMEVPARFVNCAAIDKPTALTQVLSTCTKGEILFLDELHALAPAAREHLLTAMEDQKISVKIGDPGNETIIDVSLPEFTIVAATTRQGLLDGPLRTRFRQSFTLTPYTDEESADIIGWHAADRVAGVSEEAAMMLAKASKGVARNAVNLLEAAIDTVYASDLGEEVSVPQITEEHAQLTLDRLGYVGAFSPEEWRYLTVLFELGTSINIGLKALAARLDEQATTVEEVYEPWLFRQGFVARESLGRCLTPAGMKAYQDAR